MFYERDEIESTKEQQVFDAFEDIKEFREDCLLSGWAGNKAMNKIGEGAVKGAALGTLPALAYSMADRPAEGLLTMGIAGIAGATAAAMKGARQRKTTADRKSEFYDAHGTAVGLEGAMNWDKDL